MATETILAGSARADAPHRELGTAGTRARPTNAALRHGEQIAAVLRGSWTRSDPEPATLAPDCVEEVAQLLYETGASALAWRRLRGSAHVGSPPITRLLQAYRYYALEAALHEQQLAGAFEALSRAGIYPVVTKGWAVARLYPELGLRPYRDIDLSILPGDATAARRAVTQMDEGSCPIELHAGFTDMPDRQPAELHARAHEVDLGGRTARVLCPEDELRHLCVHMLRHGATRPVWLCDIALMLDQVPTTFDWDYCLHGDARRTQWVRCALGLASRVLGADLTGTPVVDMPDRLPGWLVPAVLRQWGSHRQVLHTVSSHLATRSGLLPAIGQRWPNPIRATVRVEGSFFRGPRLPYQVACLLRLARASLVRLPWAGGRTPPAP